jgi:transcriptional regulator with XRE-family HTH domain
MYRSDLIVKAMENQGKTNESLAHETGLSHATVSAVRNGNEQVRLETLNAIADALGLDMGELFRLPRKARAS